MSLADRAAGMPAEAPVQCAFGRLLAGMSETERVAFEELRGRVTSYEELSLILREEGYKNSRHGMVRHLKGECRCDAE